MEDLTVNQCSSFEIRISFNPKEKFGLPFYGPNGIPAGIVGCQAVELLLEINESSDQSKTDPPNSKSVVGHAKCIFSAILLCSFEVRRLVWLVSTKVHREI